MRKIKVCLVWFCAVFLTVCLSNQSYGFGFKKSVRNEDKTITETPVETGTVATPATNTEAQNTIIEPAKESTAENLIEEAIPAPAETALSASAEKTSGEPSIKSGIEKQGVEIKLKEKSLFENWAQGDYATGNWFGARSYLEDHGVKIDSGYLYSPFGKTRGGMAEQRKLGGYSLYSLGITADTEKMGLWKGGTFRALYHYKKNMGLASKYMGDYQVFDGWDFREMNQVSEYWYQHSIKDNLVRMKFGKQDANLDFGYLNTGCTFLNTSFTVMPTAPMPTYPEQAFGFMAEVSPTKWMSVKNGIYNKKDTPFYLAEVEFKPTIKDLPGRYILGYWRAGGTTNATTLQTDAGGNYVNHAYQNNYGGYAGFEQMVYKEKKDNAEDTQGLTIFAQLGLSPENRNNVSQYTGGGLNYRGLIPKRDNDLTGLAVASVNFSNRLADIDGMKGHETAIEFYHRVQITPWFYLQPDIQFIYNPCGAYENAVAMGLRTVISF